MIKNNEAIIIIIFLSFVIKYLIWFFYLIQNYEILKNYINLKKFFIHCFPINPMGAAGYSFPIWLVPTYQYTKKNKFFN